MELCSLSIFTMIAIACVAVVILVMYIIKYCCRNSFEKLKVSLAERADSARNEYESLFVPSRLVEERQIDDFKTKYADLTSPGILVTEELTPQDIEKLRVNRRKKLAQPIASIPPQMPDDSVKTEEQYDIDDDFPF